MAVWGGGGYGPTHFVVAGLRPDGPAELGSNHHTCERVPTLGAFLGNLVLAPSFAFWSEMC